MGTASIMITTQEFTWVKNITSKKTGGESPST